MLKLLAILAMIYTPENLAMLQRHVEHHTRIPLTAGLFPEQAEVMSGMDRFKALVCGRRGGKTTTGARLALESADRNPKHGEEDAITPYVGPTKNQAKRLMWGRLQVVAKRHRIPMKWNATDLIGYHENGHQVWIMSADDDRDIERLRGFAFHRVIVDEAQAIGADMEDLVDDVLDPALSDYNGDLILMGTPNAACVGYFYRATTGQLLDDYGRDQWKTWTWTVLNNPFFPRWSTISGGMRIPHTNWQELAEKFLREKRAKKGWDADHPTYLREWLSRWVRDVGGLVIRWDPARDHYDGLPSGYHWDHVIGVDLGRGTKPRSVKGVPKGNFAINVWAFCEDLPDLYSVYQFKRHGMEVSEWAEKIKEVQAQFPPMATVGDCGALGEAIVRDINQRFGLSIEPAEKSEKNAAIDMLNSDLAARRVHLERESPLAKEWNILQWDEDRKREDPRFPNDLSDAALYGYRKAKHWIWEPTVQLPEVGTSEYYEHVAKQLREQRARKLRKKRKHKLRT